MSLEAFLSKYPSGKIPRQSADYGKTFVCRRGCGTRTATYTEEFIWEEMYSGVQDMFKLIDFVEKNTKATRGRRRARETSPLDAAYQPPQTPTKGHRAVITTPQSKRGHAEPGSRSQKRYVLPIHHARHVGSNFASSGASERSSSLHLWRRENYLPAQFNLRPSK
jgi:origin recognition complex subunit 1